MLNHAFGVSNINDSMDFERSTHVHDEFEKPNEDAKIFYNLLWDTEHELYPRCKKSQSCLLSWDYFKWSVLIDGATRSL